MLCCVGDLLTDIIVRPATPTVTGSDTPSQVSYRQGGSAANVAVAAAAHGPARFVGRIGDDGRGDDLIAALEQRGVECVVSRGGTTGSIVALIDSAGERSFFTDRGAALDLSAIPPDALDGVEWIHIPGYSFVDGALAETCQEVVGEAMDRDIPVSISTSSTTALVEFGRLGFLELIAAIGPRVVIANRPEAHYLLGAEEEFPGATYSVITDGPNPTRLRGPDGEHRSEPVTVPEVVDTTGAGDAFAGGFVSALIEGLDGPAALDRGHRSAAEVVQRIGGGGEDLDGLGR